MNYVLKNKFLIPFYLLAIIQVIVCIGGLINHFSPIPFWDMWNGYLEFYTHILNGEYKYIFLQHNEHRIVLTKLLFLIDLGVFGGKSYFLLIINLILMLLIVWQFFKFIDKLFIDKNLYYRNLIKLFILILLFSWTQHENITWGFQSQFYLAYLVPFFSFYLMAIFKETNQNKYFYYSCILAALSSYTMANGILTSLLIVIMTFLFRLDKIKIFIAIIICIVNYIIFFNDYQSIDRQGNVLEYLINSPIDFLLYIFTYLGSPFFYLFKHNIQVSGIFGFILVMCMIFVIIKYFKRILLNYFLIAMIIQQIYIFLTALVTASGRFSFGIEQAISSRYTTPVLISWAILFILLFYFFNQQKFFLSKSKYFIILIISLFFTFYQFTSLKNENGMKLERKLGALAIAMNIKDTKAIQRVCPSVDLCIEIGNLASKYKISVFNDDMFGNTLSSLGKETKEFSLSRSFGYVDNVQELTTNNYKIDGWFYDNKKNCDKLILVNNKNQVLGYAIHGYERQDVSKIYGKKAFESGFSGYFISSEKPSSLIVQCIDNLTYIEANIDIKPKQMIFEEYQKNRVFSGNNLEGYQVFGSYINGDSDFAETKIKYSDDILYKTGPKSDYQKVKVLDGDKIIKNIVLQVSNEWKKLNINLIDYKKENITLIFTDESDNWGEWSAFAIKKD